jgi:DNA-directed RNA polymerase specialized sigma24 family protein
MHLDKPSTASTMDEAVSVFVELRPRLFGIAYRLLGSAVESEDVVQEVWLRWQKTDRSAVVSPVAFLSKATTRLAINVAQSARVRRETYIGPWLPEPIDTSNDPEVGAQRAEPRGGKVPVQALLARQQLRVYRQHKKAGGRNGDRYFELLDKARGQGHGGQRRGDCQQAGHE